MRGSYDMTLVPGSMIPTTQVASACPRCDAHYSHGVTPALSFVQNFAVDDLKGRMYTCGVCDIGLIAVDSQELPRVNNRGVDLDVELEVQL